MASAGNRLGVPPPKNTLCTVRPQASGRSWSRSASSASTYCVNGGVPPAPRNSCELKSQYGHLRTQQGRWTSSDRGGGVRMSTIEGSAPAASLCSDEHTPAALAGRTGRVGGLLGHTEKVATPPRTT